MHQARTTFHHDPTSKKKKNRWELVDKVHTGMHPSLFSIHIRIKLSDGPHSSLHAAWTREQFGLPMVFPFHRALEWILLSCTHDPPRQFLSCCWLFAVTVSAFSKDVQRYMMFVIMWPRHILSNIGHVQHKPTRTFKPPHPTYSPPFCVRRWWISGSKDKLRLKPQEHFSQELVEPRSHPEETRSSSQPSRCVASCVSRKFCPPFPRNPHPVHALLFDMHDVLDCSHLWQDWLHLIHVCSWSYMTSTLLSAHPVNPWRCRYKRRNRITRVSMLISFPSTRFTDSRHASTWQHSMPEELDGQCHKRESHVKMKQNIVDRERAPSQSHLCSTRASGVTSSAAPTDHQHKTKKSGACFSMQIWRRISSQTKRMFIAMRWKTQLTLDCWNCKSSIGHCLEMSTTSFPLTHCPTNISTTVWVVQTGSTWNTCDVTPTKRLCLKHSRTHHVFSLPVPLVINAYTFKAQPSPGRWSTTMRTEESELKNTARQLSSDSTQPYCYATALIRKTCRKVYGLTVQEKQFRFQNLKKFQLKSLREHFRDPSGNSGFTKRCEKSMSRQWYSLPEDPSFAHMTKENVAYQSIFADEFSANTANTTDSRQAKDFKKIPVQKGEGNWTKRRRSGVQVTRNEMSNKKRVQWW